MSTQVATKRRAARSTGNARRFAAGHWSTYDLAVVARWATTTVALAGALADTHPTSILHRQLLAGGVLLAYSAARTLHPAPRTASPGSGRAQVAEEVVFCSLLALFSGGWGSPYLLAVGGALLVSGLVGGRRALLPGLGVLAAGVIAGGLLDQGPVPISGILVRALELAVMGGVGACVRRALLSAAGDPTELDRLRSAAAINDLLVELCSLAAQQPGALTVDRSVSAVVERARRLFAPDVVVVLLGDPASAILDRPWQVAAAEGALLPATLTDEELPAGIAAAAAGGGPVRRDVLGPGEGLAARSRSGLYIRLELGVRGVGVLAIERADPGGFAGHDPESLRALALHAGLAIENARIFARLRILGADEERQRFARDLHDRVGQGLASVAVTAERASIASRVAPTDDLTADLDMIANGIRDAVRDIREQLTDLRSEPGGTDTLGELLADLASRVETRSGMEVTCRVDCPELAETTEREVWHVACEAVVNAERHAGADRLSLSWALSDGVPTLTVTDDGNGLLGQTPLRRDAYGVRGMRERAEILGGSLHISSRPGAGTEVRLSLPPLPAGPVPTGHRERSSEPARSSRAAGATRARPEVLA